jgi:putative PIG3 family NAD(P)H quinone oxidoreductase
MRAISQKRAGGPELLEWVEVSEPRLGDGEVLVAVETAGVNRADLFQRAGGYEPPPGASALLGLECAGEIVAVGSRVQGWSVGERVCALLAGGGYAERVAVPVGQLLPIPSGFDAVRAAALPEAVATVYSNLSMIAGLDDPARLGALDGVPPSVLIHGGASGVGTVAIQWARAIGARVIATVGSAEKIDSIRSLGADLLIDYKREDFVERTLEATGRRGVDAVLDVVGVPYLRRVEVLAPDGHLILLGGELADTDFPLAALRAKRGTVTVSMLRARPLTQKADIVRRMRENVWPLIESGRIEPVIDRVVPIADAASAHRALEAGDAVGKIVLGVGED